jgi:hypothetical protein
VPPGLYSTAVLPDYKRAPLFNLTALLLTTALCAVFILHDKHLRYLNPLRITAFRPKFTIIIHTLPLISLSQSIFPALTATCRPPSFLEATSIKAKDYSTGKGLSRASKQNCVIKHGRCSNESYFPSWTSQISIVSFTSVLILNDPYLPRCYTVSWQSNSPRSLMTCSTWTVDLIRLSMMLSQSKLLGSINVMLGCLSQL